MFSKKTTVMGTFPQQLMFYERSLRFRGTTQPPVGTEKTVVKPDLYLLRNIGGPWDIKDGADQMSIFYNLFAREP